MSRCSFKFEFKGTGESLVATIRSHVIRAGGELTGSATEGAFTLPTPVGTFRGTYAISGQTIFLEVLEKPFFVPCGTIEARLATYVTGVKEST